MCTHNQADDEPRPRALTRRSVVGAGGVLVGAALAGCLGGSDGGGAPAAPVALAGGQQCDSCGMVIEKHPGPNGQIFYEEHTPEGHADPAVFDALKGCLFPYLFEHERRDWSASVVYVTDYSSVDYDLPEHDGTTYISSHTDSDSFAKARDLTYVVGSDVQGAMGPDFVPFSSEDDAQAFADEHGGDLVAYDDITPELVSK